MFHQKKNFSRDILKIYRNHPKCLKLIFDYNLNNGPIDTTDSNGNNILHHIVMNNDIETLISVLKHVSSFSLFSTSIINRRNMNGDTPTHIAVRNNNEEIASILENAGADLNIKNRRGEHVSRDDSDNVSSDDFINALGKALHLPPMNRSRSRSRSMGRNIFMSGGSKNYNDSVGVESSSLVLKFAGDSEQMGGRRRSRSKKSRKNRRSVRSLSRTNESSNIHDQVVAALKEMLGNEEEARAIKAGLYGMVKEKNPTLNNFDRAKKMLEYMNDKNIISELRGRIGELKNIIAEAKKRKEEQGTSVKKEKKEKKENKNSSDVEKVKKPRKTKEVV